MFSSFFLHLNPALQLNIRDDDQPSFSIYQTEMGAYAIGNALTDEKLFALCRNHGDSKGSLKFFVSHSSALVHEQSFHSQSPTATTIPPPVLPYDPPLRPKRRSRQDSISSTSEQHPLETAAGYEADLDNPERDSHANHKPTVYPHPPIPPQQQSSNFHPNSSNPPSSPHAVRRQMQPPASPPLQYPSSKTPPSERPRVDVSALEPKHMVSPPPPQSLSPIRVNFITDDHSLLPSTHNRGFHDIPSSDIGAEREPPLKVPDHKYENAPRLWRGRQQHAAGMRLKTELSKDNLYSEKESKRRRHPSESEDHSRRSEFGVPGQDNNATPDTHRSVSQHPPINLQQQPSPRLKVTSPYSGRPLVIPNVPRQPPPAVPTTSNETRPSALRPAAIPIPYTIFAAWRGEERGDQKGGSSQPSRLAKGAKSMDNLRASVHSNHPNILMPSGARRNPAQLPINRPIGATFSSSAVGLPKSYEPPRQPIRPLPVQGIMYNNSPYSTRGSPHSSGLMSPNNDPYTRPQSAFDDSVISHRLPRHVQSPASNSMDSVESARLTRGTSPSRSYQLSGSKVEPPNGHRPDRSFGMQPGAEIPYTTPPRTPISPRLSPVNSGRERDKSGTQLNVTFQNDRSSESTLRQEDQTLLSNLIHNGAESTLLPPSSDNQHRPGSPPLATEMSQSTFNEHFGEDSDSGGDDFGTYMWKKRPVAEPERPKSILRPPLKVQTHTVGKSLDRTSDYTASVPSPPLSRPPPVPPVARPQRPFSTRTDNGFRTSTFNEGTSWATRPPPEDVYERLEEFFPEHDLDKPVIEAHSGGTSPTATEPAVVPVAPIPAVEKHRHRGKKSIRIVAEEHKKLIDRTSRGDPKSYSNIMRKRSTKLWGSKLEEVTTVQVKVPGVQSTPDSPSGGPSKFDFPHPG